MSADVSLHELLHPSCVLYLLSNGWNPARWIIGNPFFWSRRWSSRWCFTMRARESINQGGWVGDVKIKVPVGQPEGQRSNWVRRRKAGWLVSLPSVLVTGMRYALQVRMPLAFLTTKASQTKCRPKVRWHRCTHKQSSWKSVRWRHLFYTRSTHPRQPWRLESHDATVPTLL